jgi:hypothetical protein
MRTISRTMKIIWFMIVVGILITSVVVAGPLGVPLGFVILMVFFKIFGKK